VVAGGKEGSVGEIGLFVTLLDTLDNRRICVANTAILGGPIENFSAHPTRRVDIDVKIDRNEDIDASRTALEAAARDVASQDGRRGEVFLKGLGMGYVEWQVRVWTPAQAYWDVWQATVRAVAYQLGRSKISLSMPVMNLSVSGPAQPGWELQQTGTRPAVR
jgi:small conductance mechanosensitive channel